MRPINQYQAPTWLRHRTIGKCKRGGAQVSIDSMRRLQLESSLEGHTGCVNCLEWNLRGDLLASGSDDHNVIIWDPFKLKQKNLIQTGHKGNIFSVKFISNFSDNLIASCASDGAVKVINVLTNESIIDCTNCHTDRVKRLAVHPNAPHLVWSAGEDSMIMQYDIRVPHSCRPNNPNNLMIDLRSENVQAKCLAVNPMRDEMIAVGSNDKHVRLFDRRCMRQNSWQSCTAYFTPGHLLKQTPKPNRLSIGTTYLAFSPDGSELLANMHAEHIYLFNTYEPWERYKSFETTLKPLLLDHPTPHTTDYVRKSIKLKPYSPWKELHKLFTSTELPESYRDFYKEIDEKVRSKQKLTKPDMDRLNILLVETKSCVELYQLRAGALIQRAWKGDYYQAIRDCCCALALRPLDERSLEHLAMAIKQLGDKESAQGLLEMLKLMQPKCLDDLNSLQVAIKVLTTSLRGHSRDSSASSWIDELQRHSTSAASPTDSHSDLGRSSSSSSSSSAGEEEDDSNGNMSTIYRLLNQTKEFFNDPTSVGTETFDYSRRYCGHCNMNTDIKEANFFGYNGEFIVGGSDDGAFYIWDRATTNVVKAVHGDLQILNCVQPHPSICMLATSGIEPVVRLWSPTGKINHDITSLEVRCAINQDFITSDPLEAMIMLLYPQGEV